MEKLDDIEQYSRRNCLLFTGIVEKDDENTNQLTFPEFHFETEAKVDFPSACI